MVVFDKNSPVALAPSAVGWTQISSAGRFCGLGRAFQAKSKVLAILENIVGFPKEWFEQLASPVAASRVRLRRCQSSQEREPTARQHFLAVAAGGNVTAPTTVSRTHHQWLFPELVDGSSQHCFDYFVTWQMLPNSNRRLCCDNDLLVFKICWCFGCKRSSMLMGL